MIYLNQTLLTKLITFVDTSDEECCGFFFGYEADQRRTITDIMRVNNTSRNDKQRSFEIAPKDYLRAENFADRYNLQLLGVYHSHPNYPAIPSDYDRVAAQPNFSYIILSVMNKHFEAIRSWNLNSNLQFQEEPVVITYINQQLHGYRNHSNTAT